jgi:hypothetical protein
MLTASGFLTSEKYGPVALKRPLLQIAVIRSEYRERQQSPQAKPF